MPLSREELLAHIEPSIDIEVETDVLESDCDNIVFLFENCEITVPEEYRFFVDLNCIGLQRHICYKRNEKYWDEFKNNPFYVGEKTCSYDGNTDFSHTNTEWQFVISKGIIGIKKRVEEYAEKNRDDAKKQRFYTNVIRVYDAALKFIERASTEARKAGKTEMADGLLNLVSNPPKNLFEAMQTSIVYYVLQHVFDGTVLRTLGRLDSLFYPYYVKEDKDVAKKMMIDFLQEAERLKAPANMPFAIGGTDVDGNSLVNELSYMIIDAYEEAGTNNVKFHLLCSKNTPQDLIERTFLSVRNGNNSVVFMSDEKVIESLVKHGIEYEDAVDYHVVGCYEAGGNGELCSSCNGRVNIPKALEFALNKGIDVLTGEKAGLDNDGKFETFEDLYTEFERQLVYLSDCSRKVSDWYESHYNKIHAAPILSATYTSALEKGGDLYCDYAAKYNSASINFLGLATAVDSLAAIRKVVYEDKLFTLDEFNEILKSNWKDNEVLRLTIKNKYPKFGMGDEKTDALATRISNTITNAVTGKPNIKGGKYRYGLLSINWRWEFGEKTAASADGRLSGETISQNSSATVGADKNGATAHLMSVTAVDASNTPSATIVDIDLHSSAVKGENGLKMLVAALKTYFERGGFAVHYNILDTKILEDAKLHPEKYPNLQVRLCGWNVLFNTLSEKEKEEFIARSIR